MLPLPLALAGCLYLGEDDFADRMADFDQDGYASLAAHGADCNDEDPAVHPRAPEVCSDGIDNDCDGSPGACRQTGSLDLVDTDGFWTGHNEWDYAGFAVAALGDQDGDGVGDLAFGAPWDGRGSPKGGAVYLFRGPVQTGADVQTAEALITGEAAGEDLGTGVAAPGDVDGDGLADLLVGADRDGLLDPAPGTVALFLGPLAGDLPLSSAFTRIDGEQVGDLTGIALAGAGDVDGDGRSDLLVGAPSSSVGGQEAQGAAYLVLAPGEGAMALYEADARILGPLPGDALGASLAGGGDVDGDGVPEILVGGHGAGGYRGEEGAGAAWLLTGSVRGDVETTVAEALVLGETSMDHLGYRVAMADLDGDGFDDVLTSAPYQDHEAPDEGTVSWFRGPVRGQKSARMADRQWFGPWEGAALGTSLTPAGDVDGDGHPDLLVGAAGSLDTLPGTAWLLYGPVEEAELAASLRMDGTAAGDQAGFATAAGEVSGDAWPDLLVGAFSNDRGGENAGAVFLVLGRGW